MEPALLEFNNVTVRRGARTALHDVTLRIGRGEHVAIVGPNGCGKSTLIKTITRELYPVWSPGCSVRLLGEERHDIFALRSHLGIVSNDLAAQFTRDITGLDAVVSGFFSSVGVWPHQHTTAAMRQSAMEALSRLDAGHLAERTVDEMSSGEVRRIVIARALVHGAEALVFDEPANSLDLRAMHELREIMRSLARGGTGIVLVTHHLPDIIPEIERVLLMKDGRIVADGSKREVLTSGTLSELFGMPLEVSEKDGYFNAW